MRKSFRLALAALLGAALMASSAPAFAKDGDVIKRGTCSAGSTYKLKLSPENGRIETSFEVDQNVNGQSWHVVLRHNGTIFFNGTRVTQPPSGSFEVSRLTGNAPGTDNIGARATNAKTGEVCKVSAVFAG